ncbi:MAG: hypothetical protein DSY32_00065 [Aquifex sp.]|nr:MAG: hypothetical protein DSY32_00065 [Aquifex sp.]
MTDKKILLSLAMELIGLEAVVYWNSVLSFILYLIFHGIASLLIAIALKLILPKRYKEGSIKTFFAVIFFTGFLGYALALVVYLYLLLERHALPPVYEPVSQEDIPEISFKGRKLGEGAAYQLNPKTVLYLTQFNHPAALNLLKKVVSSRNDELRLTAFSVIYNLEKTLIERISILKESMEKTKSEIEYFSVLSLLAELYWEIVYTGLADKELEKFYLHEALSYVKRALDIREEPKLLYLTGRIYLRLKEWDKAKEYLLKALEKGFSPERVIPYLIEVLFYKKDFKGIFSLAEKYSKVTPADFRTMYLLRMWI